MSSVRTFFNSKFAGKDSFDVAASTLTALAALYGTVKLYKLIQKYGLKKLIVGSTVALLKAAPGSSAAIESEKQKAAAKLEKMVIGAETASLPKTLTLPAAGTSEKDLLASLTNWSKSENSKWNQGQVSGGIYHGGTDLLKLCTDVYSMFALANPLHPDVFPFVRKMEAEVISMCLNLFNAPTEAGGAMTSGGTESILMAFKAYRDFGYSKGITEPEMIIPVTAHAAFDKAAHYFRIKLIKVPVNRATFRADVSAMAKYINSNTIAIVGSAPSFPQGVIDPISELSELALKHKIGLHVDCCLGSFLVAYLEKLGYNPPLFDFRLKGVTSISCDTHKYGFAPKGSSVIMFNNRDLRSYMYFVAADWTGGIYASPTMPGSRPGGLVAATWAAMVHLGQPGYENIFRQIMEAARKVRDGVKSIEGLQLCGNPDMSVIAFETPSNPNEIFKVGEAMGKRHWNLNTLQRPQSIHICVTYMHVQHVDRFLDDLRWAVKDIKQNPDNYKNGSAAMYGMAASIPDDSLIEDMAKAFVDCLFKA